ncbi:hypothetical protein [Marivita geojedonensis]|nr:hypothetical protein [Marivita geojedonensis]
MSDNVAALKYKKIKTARKWATKLRQGYQVFVKNPALESDLA